MRKTFLFFNTVFLLAVISACYKDDISSLQYQIDELKSTQIASISSQISSIMASINELEKMDADLRSYIDALSQIEKELEDSLSQTEATLAQIKADLVQKEAALSSRIDELKAYVYQELINQKDWVSATFSTLEQYQNTCNEIVSIKQSILNLESALKGLISDAESSIRSGVNEQLTGYYTIAEMDEKISAFKGVVSDAESSIKSWINDRLTGYYTIAEMDAKISAMKKSIYDGDESQALEIAMLKTELETAKTGIKSAYEKAIYDAITTCAGKINEKIAVDIKTATDALLGQIEAISSRLDSIESRLNSLETSVAKLIEMVQSIVVVPDYSDGSVSFSTSAFNYVRFEIYPLEAAAAIAQKGVSILHLDYVETMTKSSETFVNLPITSVYFTGKTLLLTVDGRGLSNAVVEGRSSACARLMISDGTNTRSSDYFPLFIRSIENAEVDYPIVPEGHPAIDCMIKKAHQIADIQWTPVRPVPTLSDEWLPAGTVMYGIPYSSVKEKDKFVGQEVSFNTFMSAVNNPRSVLYTENVKEPPYLGDNCGPYYGTVCSMAVNYALGIELPIESKMYTSHPLFATVKKQDISGLFPGDVLWSPGHVVLLLDIQRDGSGNPQSLSILESAGKTRISLYSISDFNSRWNRDGWVAYRYLRLGDNTSYTPMPFVHIDGDPDINPEYNEALCTSRGDCVCYREGEDVVINVFSSSYKTLAVVKDGSAYKQLNNNTDDITMQGLPYGDYRVRLENNNAVSKEISFEIIDTSVNVFGGKEVHFSSMNAVPEYYVICDIYGARELIQVISEREKDAGFFSLKKYYSGYYLKVFFKGKYGRVSNKPIRL